MIGLRENKLSIMDWVKLAQNGVRWLAFMNSTMEIRFGVLTAVVMKSSGI
jgi:hypothetical protein